MARISEIPGLAAHLPDPIVVVDVGCRWGFAEHWEGLVPHIRLFGLDADEAEIERLRETHRDRPHARFTAATLGASRGSGVLLTTREPGSTSLFEPTLAGESHLVPYDGAIVESSARVDIVTLDTWAAETGVDRVDAMKLDTQGSELDILRGGAVLLEHVRHIEIEVSFNEMARGAPLFGEVDSFLRANGFALWRFRDLVHYGLADALDPPATIEHFWYESRAQAVPMPGGQLSWCNAHFVRQDMYDPAPRPGWASRLRDACLTQVNGLPDLALLSLKRLLDEECPAALHADVTAILAPETATGRPAAASRLRRALRRPRG